MTTADNAILIRASNTGIGTRDHEVRIALEPFVQVDKGKAQKHKCSGLGLCITRLLILRHGGNLKIHGETGKEPRSPCPSHRAGRGVALRKGH